MKYFKDANNDVYAFEKDGSQDNHIPSGLTLMTTAEVDAHINPKPTKQELATQYQRDRAAEYAKLNQDELRFNDMMNATTTWKDAILAIKAKYPKPI